MRPAQLPADVSAFTGRARELAALDTCLEGPGPLHLAVISGVGGVGKTGLAVHWAHRVAGRFPDGQLYALLGRSRPEDVLERFLVALGVARVPEGLEERAGLYRSMLRNRKVLVLLDDAESAAQVRPLLPGSGGCCVVVTGRRGFADLVAGEGARPIALGTLPVDEAAALMARLTGTAGAGPAAPAGLTELAELCDGLPLALRIAAARLATRPGWTPATLAARLTEERRRLDELRAGELDVRASFALSYRELGEAERLLFRRLGLLDACAGFAPWAVAALLDVPLGHACELLERLAYAQLVQPLGPDAAGQDRYRLHDLVRLFAEELVAADPPAERHAALERVYGCLLGLAQDAYLREYSGGFRLAHGGGDLWRLPPKDAATLLAEPFLWLDAERTALVSAVHGSARLGLTRICWDLALTGVRLFEVRGYLGDWRATATIGLRACEEAGDETGAALMRASLGACHVFTGRHGEAGELLESALPYLEGTMRALALGSLARAELRAGRAERARELLAEAHRLAIAGRDRATEAVLLILIAEVYVTTGRVDFADATLAWAAALAEGIRRPEARVTLVTAEVAARRGDHERAAVLYGKALRTTRDLRDRLLEWQSLFGLAATLRALGRPREAATTLGQALALAEDMADETRIGLTRAAADPPPQDGRVRRAARAGRSERGE
ncbi:tetratricopeptide repeat protein [Bailinhaonella thermotolerans]|uniref:Tetratricopeptide repeat protein n=1 Tax=Bailinhaonella thermotolerans TaxID=1070861 RepID=A0A3A4AR61_9ACTN|nr:tetratricopeptide repeat protein [Bailinhaonella thermotolerans]